MMVLGGMTLKTASSFMYAACIGEERGRLPEACAPASQCVLRILGSIGSQASLMNRNMLCGNMLHNSMFESLMFYWHVTRNMYLQHG